MPPKRPLKKGAKKGKKKVLPPPPPPPDPREELVKELARRYFLDMEPPTASNAITGYETELPQYPLPAKESYKTASGLVIEKPYLAPLNPHSHIRVPTDCPNVDIGSVRRCWNLLRLYYEPLFASQTQPLSEVPSIPLYSMYKFLTDREEVFAEGFPKDVAKWIPLWELIKMNYYLQGEDWVCQVYAKRKVVSSPMEINFLMSVEAGDIETVASLLQEDPSLVNLPNVEGHFPITYAADKADHHLLHYLLLSSAMVNAPGPSGDTALHLAALKGLGPTVKLLVSYGADVGARNAYGETPIHYAAQRGDGEIVGVLAQQPGGSVVGMDTYRMKRNPVHVAARGGHIEVIKKLIEAKAEMGARDEYGYTPVMLAKPFPDVARVVALADPFMTALLKDKKKKGAAKGRRRR